MIARRLSLIAALLSLTIATPAAAKTAPFPIPDMDIEAIGVGPGNGARLAISEFQYLGPHKAPKFLPVVQWTIRAGQRRPTRHHYTHAELSEGAITFVPGGSLLAHAETVTTDGKKSLRLFMADLSPAGRVRSDMPISGAAQGAAAAKAAPLVGADGTIAQRFGEPAGDTPVPQYLTLQPSGQGPWTTPSRLPDGDTLRHELLLAKDGSGGIVSAEIYKAANALRMSRFGRDGQLAPPLAIDLSAVRPADSDEPLDLATTITDSGTIVIALSVPATDGNDAHSHLLLITLAAGASTASVQDVGESTMPSGNFRALEVASTGGDTATVLARGKHGTFRVFDAPTAATPNWAPSTLVSGSGIDGRLVRLHRGGLAAIWASDGKRGTILAAHRAPGAAAFSTPKPLSGSKNARGNPELLDTALLANDEVLVTYERYGTSSEGDGAFALIGRP